MKNLFATGTVLTLCILTIPVFGQIAATDIAQIITPYSYSQKIHESNSAVSDHSLAMGAMKKIRGIWMPEVAQRIDGELFRVTLQADQGHSASEVFQYYRNRLLNSDAREIFGCNGRRCGSSNSWANDHYGIKELYGLDSDQYYNLFEILDDKNQLHYLNVYAVSRGNKRVFVQVEWLKTALQGSSSIAPSSEVITQQLLGRRYYIVSGVSNDGGEIKIDEDHLAVLVTALKSRRVVSFRIVGHDYQGDNLNQQQQRSLDYAEMLRQRLVAAGIKEDRMEAHGVGSLAPAKAGAKQTMRLEIVLF